MASNAKIPSLKAYKIGSRVGQRPLQNRLAEPGISDDLVRRVGTDLDPVALRVHHV